MPLVTLLDLENSFKMNQLIKSASSNQIQQLQQQQSMASNYSSSPSSTNLKNLAASSSGDVTSAVANLINANVANNAANNSNLIANEIINHLQHMNRIDLNAKLLSNIQNNLMLNGIKASATSILNGLNFNLNLNQTLQQQHAQNQKQVNYSRYKTELCRQFSENGE